MGQGYVVYYGYVIGATYLPQRVEPSALTRLMCRLCVGVGCLAPGSPRSRVFLLALGLARNTMLRSLREPLLEPPSSSHHRPSTFRCGLTLFAALPAFFFVALFCNRTLHPRPAESLQAQPWLEFALWESALGGNRLEEVHPYSVVPLAPPDVTLTVRPEDERQSIVGFGGAITQASGTVWRRLSPQLRQRVVELFFGASGIGASLARVPINSCDFAEASYSEDDVPDDYDLSHFDDGLAHDERLLLPLVRAALAVGGPRLQLLASPWSPPA